MGDVTTAHFNDKQNLSWHELCTYSEQEEKNLNDQEGEPNKQDSSPSKHLVVGFDFSTDARRASRMAVQWAKEMDDATIIYVSVVEPSDTPRPGVLRNETRPRPEQVRRLEADLTTIAEEHTSPNPNVRFSCEVRCGHPGEQLLEAIQRHSPHLAFVGRRGRSRSAPWEVGGTATQVVRFAPCPVLVAQPIEDTAAKRGNIAPDTLEEMRRSSHLRKQAVAARMDELRGDPLYWGLGSNNV